jgi:hypothetical protein
VFALRFADTPSVKVWVAVVAVPWFELNVTVNVPRVMVIVVALDEAAEKPSAAALVAVTSQVPAEVNERVEPETVQPAVPAVAVKVLAPVPLPPLVVNASVEPVVPAVDVTDSAAWFSRP